MIEILNPNNQSYTLIQHAILGCKLVSIPTETVYGLAADATSDKAVKKIFDIKSRPTFNPLIVHVANIDHAREYVEWTEEATLLAKHFWPGPLTLVLNQKKHSSLSKYVTAGLNTVALRMPNHPIALEIIKKSGKPLAAPSANISGTLSPTAANHVQKQFKKGDIDYIIDGGSCEVGIESTVVHIDKGKVNLLRLGKIQKQDIEKLGLDCIEALEGKDKIISPGQLLKHYAPTLPVRLNAKTVEKGEALLAFGDKPLTGAKKSLNLSLSSDLTEAASNLFKMLHELDQSIYTSIAVMPVPNKGIGQAINDRLKKAAS